MEALQNLDFLVKKKKQTIIFPCTSIANNSQKLVEKVDIWGKIWELIRKGAINAHSLLLSLFAVQSSVHV